MNLIATLETCKLTSQALLDMYKGVKTISDVFLARKIEKFAEEPFSEKSQKFIDEMEREKFQELQDQIIHALTQAESTIKAMYLKKMTEAYCEKRIDWLTFCRMTFILGQIFTFDFESLVKFYNYEFDGDVTQNKLMLFAQLGLVNSNINDEGDVSMCDAFSRNNFGRIFIECVLSDLDESLKKRIEDRRQAALKGVHPFKREN